MGNEIGGHRAEPIDGAGKPGQRVAAQVAEIEKLQERFLSQHLGAWISRFAGAVKEGAQTGFYRELAELAPDVVRAAAAVH